MSTPITDIFNQNKKGEEKEKESPINQIDFAKAFEVGLQQGQDISPTSFSFLLNTISSKTGKQSTFSFDDKSKDAFKNKYGAKQLKQAEALMAQSLMTNNTVNSIASYYAPNRTVNQLYDPEYAMFFPQAKMTSFVKPKTASIEFEWNGMATPITKFTTEEIADVNSVFYDSYAKTFKPLNKDVLKKWETDDWSLGGFADGLNDLFGKDKQEGTERVTLMRNEDIAKLDTEDGRRIKSDLALGNLNAKDIFRLQDTDGNFKPIWRTVKQDEDPFDLNNIRSVWGPKTINNNNIAIEALESFNDSFMSALDGAYFTTYGARKLTSPFLSPFLRDSDFNKQLENEYNEYQQWSQGRRSTGAEEESEHWYKNMTNLTKGVANGLGQLVATAGVGFAGKMGTNVLMGASKAIGSKMLTNTLSTLPANIARGFSASYAMGAAQQEARRAGLSENESMLMAGLAGVTLQLSEKMIGGNDSWLYRSFLPKDISSKAGQFITQRVQAEAKLAGKTIADTLQQSGSRSKIMQSTLKWLTEETDSWWKAGVQSFAQESFQEVTEDGINKLNQFGFNTVADGLKASGYDWINDESRYKINLKDTLQELAGSFVIGGLTGAVSGSAMTAFNSDKDIDKQLDGAKMNSLVYHYVDNRGDTKDYFDQLELLKNNDLTGSPYVSSKVDKDSKTRTLWDKIGLGISTSDNTKETDASKYAYNVMKAEAEWVFGRAQKIESQMKAQGVDPWENAQRFGQQLTEALDLQPKAIKDVLMVDGKGKIMTLDPKTYQEVIKNYSPEELSKLQVNVLTPEAANRTKVDLTVRDIESSVFLEGMSVYNRKNDVQKSLALQLAKRDSNSLFREINPFDVTAFDGNYKGTMVDRELSYEDEFDKEYTENFNKLRSEPVKEVKTNIKEQQKLMLEVRDIETQIEEIENKAERYGYGQVAPEVLKELELEKIEKLKLVEELEGKINFTLDQSLQLSGSEERNSFKTDLRNLVDYENYTDRLADRIKYYESKSQFNRLYNDSTFTQELGKLLKNKGWSPYDYDEDKRKRSRAEQVINKMHSKLIEQTNQVEEIKQREITTDKELSQLLEDIKELKFVDANFKTEINKKLKEVSTSPVSKVKNKVTNTLKNLLKNGLDKSDVLELNNRKIRQFTLLDRLENLNTEQLKNLKKAYNNPLEFLKDLESVENQTIDLGVINLNLESLEDSSGGEALDIILEEQLNNLVPKQLLEAKLNEDSEFSTLLQSVKDDYNKQFEEAKILYTIKNLTNSLQEAVIPDVEYLINNQLQDNNEGFILEEASKALRNKYVSTELESPNYYKNIASQVNSILPRLFYHYGDKLVGEDLELYKLVTNPTLVSAESLPKLRQRYKEIIQGEFKVSQDHTVHPVVQAVILREELEQTAIDLESALSKRYLQDINFQHDYITDKRKTLKEFIDLLNDPKFDVVKTNLANFTLDAKVIPSDNNEQEVEIFVENTINNLVDFLNLEKQLSSLLTEEDALKLSKALLNTKSVEEKAFLFRRFDDKGIKYKKEELGGSAQLERDLNYLFLLLRGNEDYYKDLKNLLSKTDETKDFIINVPQFFSLRQAYSFLAGNTLPESLTNYLSEQVRLNIIQHQKEVLQSDTEYIILDPTLIKNTGDLRWGSQIYNLQGIPGVGKTEYLLKHALKLNKYKDPSAKILITAPGDSQLETLKNSLKNETNIQYLSWKEFEGLSKEDLNSFDLVVIDESSLLPPNKLVATLDQKLNKNTKLILSGDQLQESSNGVYALYTESTKSEHTATLFITERGETLDVSVRSGLVDLQKYIEAVASYIPGVNNFVGRGFKTAGASTAIRNEMKTKAIEKIQATVKPAEFSYYQEGGVTKRGVQLTNNFKEFIDQFKKTRDSGLDAYFIIPTATDFTSKKEIITELNKAGIIVTNEQLEKGTHPFVMLSRVAQGKTLKNVFTPFMLRDNNDPIQATANLSGFFVATSRAVDSLVVFQPERMYDLLPFTSTQVSSEAKILTYPPFKIGDDLSEDTKIRQENFISFINKLDTNPNSVTEEKNESKETQQEPDDVEQEQREEDKEDKELEDWKTKVGELIGSETNPSMQEFKNLIINLTTTSNNLIVKEKQDILAFLETNYPVFDSPFNALEEADKKTLVTNTNNFKNVFNNAEFDYISNNKLIETIMTNKMNEINEYNKNQSSSDSKTTTKNSIDISDNNVDSRGVTILINDDNKTDEQIKQTELVGFHIKVVTGEPTQVSLLDQFTILTQEKLTDELKVAAEKTHKQGIEYLARLTQVIGSSKEQWKKFIETATLGGKSLKDILKEKDAEKLLKSLLLKEDVLSTAFKGKTLLARQGDLFNFNLSDLDSAQSENKHKIIQLILLSGSPFAAEVGINNSDFNTVGYIGSNEITAIQQIRLTEKSIKVDPAKQTSTTRPDNTANATESNLLKQLNESIKDVTENKKAAEDLLNTPTSSNFNYYKKSC